MCRKRWLVQLFCRLQFSQGQIERGKFKQGALEVDNQPSILRTDGFREHIVVPWQNAVVDIRNCEIERTE